MKMFGIWIPITQNFWLKNEKKKIFFYAQLVITAKHIIKFRFSVQFWTKNLYQNQNFGWNRYRSQKFPISTQNDNTKILRFIF